MKLMHNKVTCLSQRKALVQFWISSCTSYFFFMKHDFLVERKLKDKYSYSHLGVWQKIKKQIHPLNPSYGSICCQLQNLSFEAKITILENLYLYHEIDSLPVLRDVSLFKLLCFSETSAEINSSNVSEVYNKICQHFKDLYSSVNQQCHIINGKESIQNTK